MDIAAQNNLASYGVFERGLDLHAGNLAARINADIINVPTVKLRRDYGEIQLLPDTQSCMKAVTTTTCLPWGGSQPTGAPHGYDSGYTTVYTTECIQVCPTETPCPKGTKTNTYTITETCSGNVADYTRPILPPDFTTVVTVCTVCEGKPTMTVTCPISEAIVTSTAGSNGGPPAEAPVCEGCEGGAATVAGESLPAATGGAVYGSSPSEAPVYESGEEGAATETGGSAPTTTGGAAAATGTPKGYVQAATASNFYAKTAAVLLGGVVALASWLL